jgi:hypothetical protein
MFWLEQSKVCRTGDGINIPLSMARALGTTLIIFDAWANVGVSGRVFWVLVFFCTPWVVDMVCSKALDWQVTFVWKFCMGVVGRRNSWIWVQGNILRMKLFVNANVTSVGCGLTLCWGLCLVASKGIGQCGSSLDWLFLYCYSSVWRNCYWYVHMPSESWNSEPLKQIMDGAARQWVHVSGFIIGWGWPVHQRQRKKWCREW